MATSTPESLEVGLEQKDLEASPPPEQEQHRVTEDGQQRELVSVIIQNPQNEAGEDGQQNPHNEVREDGQNTELGSIVIEGNQNQHPSEEARNLPQPKQMPKPLSKLFKGLIAAVSIIGTAAFAAILAPPARLDKITRGYLFSFYSLWGFLCLILSLSVTYMVTLNRGGKKSLFCCTGIAVFSLVFTGYIGLLSLKVAYSTWFYFTAFFAAFFIFLVMLPVKKQN